jgi:hypothetical protein
MLAQLHEPSPYGDGVYPAVWALRWRVRSAGDVAGR